VTPPSKLHKPARAVAASTSRARQESVPIKKATSARKATAKKASLKSVESPPAKKAAAAQPVADEEMPLAAEPEATDDAVDDADLEDLALESLDVDLEAEALTADVVVDLESEEVVLTVGKKRSLDDIDESAFEPAEEAKLEEELAEDEGFTLSEADDADEPEQQVMAAGATADPVKDYLKQIGKVALLNAEQEVELAKRDCSPTKSSTTITQRSRHHSLTISNGSPRTVVAPRTTCWKPISAWWFRWPSAIPDGECSSSISSKRATWA
jgi:RNA polymerase primary sigma factor